MELAREEIREISLITAHLDKAAPQMSVQFSGGEPQFSPHFIE